MKFKHSIKFLNKMVKNGYVQLEEVVDSDYDLTSNKKIARKDLNCVGLQYLNGDFLPTPDEAALIKAAVDKLLAFSN